MLDYRGSVEPDCEIYREVTRAIEEWRASH